MRWFVVREREVGASNSYLRLVAPVRPTSPGYVWSGKFVLVFPCLQRTLLMIKQHPKTTRRQMLGLCPRGATQGYVLDGFPNTEEDSQLLENIGIIPYIFIILQCSIRTSEKMLEKISANLYRQAPIYSVELLRYKHNAWEEVIPKNLARLSFENKNLLLITEDKSKWKLHQDIKEKIFVVMQSYNNYFQGIGRGSALSLEHSCISSYEFGVRQNRHFKNYCPVCLSSDESLVMGSIQNDRGGLVEYNVISISGM